VTPAAPRPPRAGAARRLARRFARAEDAAVSIEAAIILPVLLFLFLLGFTAFDAFRREAVIAKATYAVGDILSRTDADEATSPSEIEGLEDVFELISFAGAGNADLRVTEIRRVADDLRVIWSYGTDGQEVLDDDRLDAFLDRIPQLENNERILAVESFANYTPPFDIGIGSRRLAHFIPLRVRENACLSFDASDTGATPGCLPTP
jgi:hypothetical protein